MGKRNEKRIKKAETAGVVNAQTGTVRRYGSAVKEHNVALSGQDRETGQTRSRSLRSVSKSKVDPGHKKENIKQQAGYSAEIKSTARENAEKAIAGEETRAARTDDIPKQSDGKGGTIGGRNDQLYDLAEVDKNGIYVEGTARQLKFVGGTPEECAKKLLSKKYDKYRDADVDIEVPKDFYDKVNEELTNKASKLEKEIENAEKKGNTELASKKENSLIALERLKTT